MAAREAEAARAIAAAVYEADPCLVLIGLAGSRLIEAGAAGGLGTGSEVFADRTYQADGSLTPRDRPDALITDANVAVAQVLRMVGAGKVCATDGSEIAIRADTICLHGDGPGAMGLARRVSAELKAAGVEVRPLGG